MANFEPYDYLTTISPDYSATTLSVTPQGIMYEDGSKNVIVHRGDDRSRQSIIFSSDSIIYARLTWTALSRSDSGTIFDFYHDPNKACAQARSFKWAHPTDSHTYVVYFASTLSRFKQNASIYGFNGIILELSGRIAD